MLGVAEEPVDLVREQALLRETERSVARPLEELLVLAQPDEAKVGEARLACAEKLALAADLEVALGELEPVRRRDHRVEALHRVFRQLLRRPRDEEAVRLLRPAPDSPAQLVELREPEAV